MKKERLLTVLLIFIAVLFIAGKALRTAWLPHVKVAIVNSGSITYSFPGGQSEETADQEYLLKADAGYADCFTEGSLLRWVPYSDTDSVRMLKITAVELSDSACTVTLQATWAPDTVIIQDGDIQVDSPFYPALLPRTAFVSEDTVYILQQNLSAGRADYVVAACKVKTGIGNDQYIPCIAGISAGAQVLVAWDRPLTIGRQVEIVDTVNVN